jgi:hypothetical protein
VDIGLSRIARVWTAQKERPKARRYIDTGWIRCWGDSFAGLVFERVELCVVQSRFEAGRLETLRLVENFALALDIAGPGLVSAVGALEFRASPRPANFRYLKKAIGRWQLSCRQEPRR